MQQIVLPPPTMPATPALPHQQLIITPPKPSVTFPSVPSLPDFLTSGIKW